MRNIGFVSRYPPTHCGIAEYTKFLVSALRSLNPKMNITVFTTTESKNERYIDEIGVEVVPCFERFEKKYDGLFEALSERKIEILHVQHEYGIFGNGNEIVNAMTKIKEEKLVNGIVITTHTVDHPYTERPDVLNFQKSLNSFDSVIVHSDLQEFELITQGVNSAKINQIPHGTLINPYLSYTKTLLSKSLGINGDFCGMVLAIPGFMRKDKGIDILLGALEKLDDLKFTVILAGESKDSYIKELIKEFESKIIFIDRYLNSDEILRIVALADSIILPYKDRKGAYAVSGILHLSMGGLKPVIGSRSPRLVELCQFAPWMTIPPNNIEMLASRIRWLVENYEYAVSYMSELYAYAARTQWISVAHNHYGVYKKTLGHCSLCN